MVIQILIHRAAQILIHRAARILIHRAAQTQIHKVGVRLFKHIVLLSVLLHLLASQKSVNPTVTQ